MRRLVTGVFDAERCAR